jgi:hypothetical protein
VAEGRVRNRHSAENCLFLRRTEGDIPVNSSIMWDQKLQVAPGFIESEWQNDIKNLGP